jgi:hypothetical protein
MTTTERYAIVAVDAYNAVWSQSRLPEDVKRIAAFNAAFDAVKAEGASAQAATQAADFARDEAR